MVCRYRCQADVLKHRDTDFDHSGGSIRLSPEIWLNYGIIMPKIHIISLLVTVFLVLQTSAFADNTDAYFQPAEIHDAVVTISNQDTSGDLRFRIVNSSSGKLTILGVSNAYNVQSKIMGRIDANNYTE